MPQRSVLYPFLQAFNRHEEPLLAAFGNAPDFQRAVSLLFQPENLVPRMAEAGPSPRGSARKRALGSLSKPSLD